VLTRRGKLALLLGLVVYLAAWAFGSTALYPVAVGFLLAVAIAAATVHLAARPMRYRRYASAREHIEGDDVSIDVELQPSGPVMLAAITVVERIAKLGERTIDLRRHGRTLRGRVELREVPRGRYALEEARAVLEDPFGFERTSLELPAQNALLVLPRIVDIETPFSESGPRAHDGRRLLLRRPSGFDVHSVREYEEGESLRKVHWRSTARRGQLMVKELQDEPRDEVAIVLDAAAGPNRPAFDAQVRAAGSLLKAQVWRDRRSVLVITSIRQETLRVQTYAGDWRAAIEALAAAEATGRISLAGVLADESGPVSRAYELALITSRLEPMLVDRLIQRALAQRRISVVYVDAPTFSGHEPGREPGLLKLQATGVPVALLRRGDDLAQVLSAERAAEAAGA
jgi:uncharacterized protein (DUF58 family)